MWRKVILALAASLTFAMGHSEARAAACAPQDFGKTVDRAGATLRAFNLENAPKLQTKLAQLAAKKNWPEEAREQKARDFLQDERIASLDASANELLAKIDLLGRPPENAKIDCAALGDLEAAGVELLAVMKAKAAYSMDKIGAALGEKARPGPAAAAGPEIKPPPAAVKAPAAKKAEAKDAPRAAQRPDGGDALAGRPRDLPAWTTTSELDPSAGQAPPVLSAPRDIAPETAPGVPYEGAPQEKVEDGYTIDEIREISRGFFGTISTNLASVLEYAFSISGRPSAYVLGTEGGGAFLAGVRYGSGDLFLHKGSASKIHWTGPSLGYDFGGESSRTMFLVYNLRDAEGLYRRFTGVDGSAYLVGGVGVTFLKGGEVLMAPIRSGLGLRIGANLGYIRFTPEKSWNPF